MTQSRNAKYEKALADKGVRHVTVRLDRERREKLKALAAQHGSTKAFFEAAIDHASEYQLDVEDPK